MDELMGILGVFDFVKSFREGSKVTIVCLGGNTNGRFVEATVYGLGGQRGFLRIPEGRGGWGWLKFVGELRKAKDSLVAVVGCGFDFSSLAEKVGGKKVVRPVDSVSLVGDFLGKAAGPLSFAEAVRSPHSFPALGCWTLVLSAEADPLGKDRCVDGSSVRRCRGCREACSVGCSMGSRDCDGTFLRKILEQFGVWLDWVSWIFSNLGRSSTSSVGLRRLLDCMGLGRVFKYFVLRGLRLRASSRRLGFKPNTKKAKKMSYGGLRI
jgi:hypothetical protein